MSKKTTPTNHWDHNAKYGNTHIKPLQEQLPYIVWSFRTKLSFGEMKLLFSVKNYCPLIYLIRRGLEKERLYQLSSQIWRQAAPGGCPSLLQPSSWGRNLSSPEADPITASPEETGPEENIAYTNNLTSSSSAHSCFLLSIQPFSLLFVSPSTQGKINLQIREAWRNYS